MGNSSTRPVITHRLERRVNVVFLNCEQQKSSGRKACLGNRFVAFSDLLVGVEHNSNSGTHSTRWEVLDELNADSTVVAVAGNNFTPSAFVVGTCSCVF